MKTENKRFGIPGKGLIAVCILAIIVSASSIITTYRMQKMASIIYEHPYTCLLYTSIRDCTDHSKQRPGKSRPIGGKTGVLIGGLEFSKFR